MITLNKDNGRIVITAKSGYGKSWLAMNLIRQFINKNYPVYSLLYTKEPVFNDLYKKSIVYYADVTDTENFIKFIAGIKPNSVVFIDDLDLYLNSEENQTEIMNIMKNFLSACRKANIILIYTIKELIGTGFTSLASLTEILIMGKFSRYSESYKHLGIDEELFNEIDEEKREFILKKGSLIDYICVDKDGIIRGKNEEDDNEEVNKQLILDMIYLPVKINNAYVNLIPLFVEVKNKIKKASFFTDVSERYRDKNGNYRAIFYSYRMQEAIEKNDFEEMKNVLNDMLNNAFDYWKKY